MDFNFRIFHKEGRVNMNKESFLWLKLIWYVLIGGIIIFLFLEVIKFLNELIWRLDYLYEFLAEIINLLRGINY